MRNKIVRADGETIITEFKSFRYVEQVNDESNLRYGAVISSFIEAEVFGSPSSAIQEGEVLTYYQVFDTDNEFNQLPNGQTNEIKIGIFTANVTTPGKNIYKFTAYDNISKLDTDFSAIMKANPNSFPMSVSSVVNLISSETGLTFNLSQCPLINLGNLVSVFYFYSNGITCRQVLSYIAEVSSCNIYCLPNGTIYAQPYISNRSETIPPPDFYWKDNYHYIICPTDQVQYTGTDSVGNPITLIPVFYKENGFKKADYTCDSLDTFSVRKTDGTVVWSMEGSNTENIYEINTNPIIDYLMLDESIDWDDIMDNVEAPIESETLKGIVPFTIQLFPFRNPFRAGEFVPYIQGSDGVRFRSLIMKMEVTESEAVLYCYGDEKWHVSSQINRTADEMNTALSAQINAVDIIRFGDQPDHNYFTIGSFKNLKDYADNIVIYYGYENSVFIQACEYWWQFDSLGNTSLPKPLTINNGGTGAKTASGALTALGAVNKAGDTMTGDLYLQGDTSTSRSLRILDETITVGNPPSSGNQYGGTVRFLDSNNVEMNGIQNVYTSGGATGLQVASKQTVGSTLYQNILQLRVNADGTLSVYTNAPESWRSAIGAVNINGDTINGNVFLEGTASANRTFAIIDKAVEVGTVPQSNYYDAGIRFRDKNSTDMGIIQSVYRADDRIGFQFGSNRVINGTRYQNNFGLYIGNSGTPTVILSSPSAWLSALGFDVESETAVSNIISANTSAGFSITSATYKKWGKVVQINLTAKKTSAVTTATDITVGTLVSGKRPIIECGAICTSSTINFSYVATNGSVVVNGTWAANASKPINIMFLAN